MDARQAARALVDELFPGALAAFLTPQVPGGAATPGGPELLVLLSGDPAPFRQTLVRDGWTVELIGHTPATLTEAFTAEIRAHNTAVLQLCAYGIVLVDTVGVAAQVRADAVRRLTVGPSPVEEAELEARGRWLWALLGELSRAEDPGEVAFVAAQVLVAAAELSVTAQRQWLSAEEPLAVRLARLDPALYGQLITAFRQAVAGGGSEPLRAVTETILNRAVRPTAPTTPPTAGITTTPGATRVVRRRAGRVTRGAP